MKVTKIQQQIKDESRANIYIDDKYVFALSKLDISFYNLKEGEEIPKEKYEEIIEQVIFAKAKMTALGYLGIKDRTTKEIIRKLKEKGFSKYVTKKTLEFLKSYGYIDDLRYAKKYVNQRVSVKGYGKNKVTYELKLKGISENIIEVVTENIEEAEQEAALKLAIKKSRKLDLDDYKDKQKLFAYLQRRGFSYQLIKSILLQLNEEVYDDL